MLYNIEIQHKNYNKELLRKKNAEKMFTKKKIAFQKEELLK